MKKNLSIFLGILLTVCLCAASVSATSITNSRSFSTSYDSSLDINSGYSSDDSYASTSDGRYDSSYSDNSANSDSSTISFHEGDVAAFQALIEANKNNSAIATDYNINAPSQWQSTADGRATSMVGWDSNTEQRISYINIRDYGLSGSIDARQFAELVYFYCDANPDLTEVNTEGCSKLMHFVCSAKKIILPNGAVIMTDPATTTIEFGTAGNSQGSAPMVKIRVLDKDPDLFSHWQFENADGWTSTYFETFGFWDLSIEYSALSSASRIVAKEAPVPAPTPAAPKSADGGMDMIYVDGAELAGFDRLVFNYTIDVPYEKTSVVFTGKMSHWGAWADNLWEIPLNVGANPVVIKTTAEDGKTNWFYTVTVNRAPEVVATPQPTIEPTPQPTEAPTPTPAPTAEATPAPAPQPTAQPVQAESESGFPTAVVAVAAVIGAAIIFVAVKKIKNNND